MCEVSDFRSLMGMWEMELTVCEIVNRHPTSSLSSIVLNRKDFKDDAAFGFSCLVDYGWLDKLPDGSFRMRQALIERIESRLQTLGV
jgi:hypothetical protein